MAIDEGLSFWVGEIAVILGVARDMVNISNITDVKEVSNRKSNGEVCLAFANLDGEGLVSHHIKVEAPRQTSTIIATYDTERQP